MLVDFPAVERTRGHRFRHAWSSFGPDSLLVTRRNRRSPSAARRWLKFARLPPRTVASANNDWLLEECIAYAIQRLADAERPLCATSHIALHLPTLWRTRRSCAVRALRRSNFSVDIPEILPALPIFPQENLAFDQARVAINRGYCVHLFVAQPVSAGGSQIRGVVARVNRKWNWCLPTLHRPFDADGRGMNSMPVSDPDNDRVFKGRRVVRRAVALRTSRGAERTIANRLNAVLDNELEQPRRWKWG